MVNMVGLKINQDAGRSEFVQLLREMQDTYPEKFRGSGGKRQRLRSQWLKTWGPQVTRLIELKGLEQAADFLGIHKALLKDVQH